MHSAETQSQGHRSAMGVMEWEHVLMDIMAAVVDDPASNARAMVMSGPKPGEPEPIRQMES